MDITINWKLNEIAKNGRNKDEFKRDIEALISSYLITALKFKNTTAGAFASKQAEELQKKLLSAIKGIELK